MDSWMEPCDLDNITEWFATEFTRDIDGELHKTQLNIGFNRNELARAAISVGDYISRVFKEAVMDDKKLVDELKWFRDLPHYLRVEQLAEVIMDYDIQIKVDNNG